MKCICGNSLVAHVKDDYLYFNCTECKNYTILEENNLFDDLIRVTSIVGNIV